MRIIITLLFCILAQNAFAQTIEWHTLTTEDGEFSMEMPAGCYSYYYNKTGPTISDGYPVSSDYNLRDMQLLSCYRDETLFSVEIYNSDKKKKFVKELLIYTSEKVGKSDLNLGKELYGREHLVNHQDYSLTSRYVASKKRIYIITAASRNKNSSSMKRFLDSVKIVSNSNVLTEAGRKNTVLISKLKSIEPEIIFDEQKNDDVKPAASDSNENKKDDLAGKRILILTIPKAGYTGSARNNFESGIIRLRLNLNANGSVDKIAVLAPLSDDLLRNAVITSLRIKFLPEERNAKPVSVIKIVEYSFNIY